jgi:hypothetical protein
MRRLQITVAADLSDPGFAPARIRMNPEVIGALLSNSYHLLNSNSQSNSSTLRSSNRMRAAAPPARRNSAVNPSRRMVAGGEAEWGGKWASKHPAVVDWVGIESAPEGRDGADGSLGASSFSVLPIPARSAAALRDLPATGRGGCNQAARWPRNVSGSLSRVISECFKEMAVISQK